MMESKEKELKELEAESKLLQYQLITGLRELAKKAVEGGEIKITSIEDLVTVINLDIKLANIDIKEK